MRLHALLTMTTVALVSPMLLAQQADEHAGHHPEQTQSTAPRPAQAGSSGQQGTAPQQAPADQGMTTPEGQTEGGMGGMMRGKGMMGGMGCPMMGTMGGSPALEQRLALLQALIEQVNKRLDQMDKRLDLLQALETSDNESDGRLSAGQSSGP